MSASSVADSRQRSSSGSTRQEAGGRRLGALAREGRPSQVGKRVSQAVRNMERSFPEPVERNNEANTRHPPSGTRANQSARTGSDSPGGGTAPRARARMPR